MSEESRSSKGSKEPTQGQSHSFIQRSMKTKEYSSIGLEAKNLLRPVKVLTPMTYHSSSRLAQSSFIGVKLIS